MNIVLALFRSTGQIINQLTIERNNLLQEKKMLLETIERSMDEQKVKLPREVAEAIELLRKAGWGNKTLVNPKEFRELPPGHIAWAIKGFVEGSDFAWLDYVAAIINGYTVEETIEERIKRGVQDIYEKWTVIPSKGNDSADGADLADRISKFVADELRL